jgi:hypothetical protein
VRTAFFILLLANAALFAFVRFGPGAEASADAYRIAQQIDPEKIRLLAPQQAGALARKSEPEATRAVAACLEWGAFSGGESTRAGQALDPLGLGARLTQRKVDEQASFWVYIPPQGGRPAATQKAGELKRLGVEDYFIVPDDPKWRFAISLGVFKTEEAAKARLDALRAKGVKSAVVGARDTQVSRTYFQVRDANATLTAKLNELRQGFPGTEVRDCSAEERKG